jgi:hypothetical protein
MRGTVRFGFAVAVLAALLPALAAGAAEPPARGILFWSPYSAGSSEQAAATMDAFARYLEKAAGWPAGSASASYVNTVEGGPGAIAATHPGFLIVPMPIFLRHHDEDAWTPLRVVVTVSGDAQRYSLFGPPGASLQALAGATLEGEIAYDSAFVAGVVLDSPKVDLDLRATSRTLSAVRRVLKGERLAVLLDEEERQALASLPQGSTLVKLAESAWMPAGIVVATRLASAADRASLEKALDRAGKDPAATELLKTMKMRRFERAAPDLLARLGKSYLKGCAAGNSAATANR